LLAPANDTDSDLARLIFSGLLKYDNQGNLIPDLAESYTVDQSGKVYEFHLRKNAFWHDGQQVNADDVIFNFQIIQNNSYKSIIPFLWANWQGVEVEKVDDFTVRFTLKNPYAAFPHNLTFGLLPKHVWQNVPAANFSLYEANKKPIGSGPYVFQKMESTSDGTITSIQLQASKNYYLGGPYIKNLTFKFYYPDGEEKAISALQKKEIQGINYISYGNYSRVQNSIKNKPDILHLQMPRYFALFMNQIQNKALADKNVRVALAQAINKQKIISEALAGFGRKVDSPLLPGMLGYTDQVKTYNFDIEQAKQTLTAAGWVDSNGDGVREKDGQALEISILTLPWEELEKTTNIIKEDLAAVGIKINIQTEDVASIKEDIKNRNYQILLFGELLNLDPDPFSFWHSSQIKDPGQNISLYSNPQVDAILQNARQDLNPDSRAKKYQQFSQIICEDLPAIFLYSPDYLYVLPPDIKGVDIANPDSVLIMISDRFSQIERWFISTKRVWKRN